MAMAALLRSVATKMARAPPRLPIPTSSGGLCLPSRFSTSTGGSMPPPANLRGSQTHDKKVSSGSRWDRAKTVAIETTTTCAFITVFGGIIIYGWVNPALDRINANLEASNRLDKEIMDEIKRGHQRIREQQGSSER